MSAIASSPIVTCSPVEAMTSSSRGSGIAWISFASPISRLVSPLMAETTTTSWWPARDHFSSRRRDILDALDRTDRGAAVFVNDQGHVGSARDCRGEVSSR